MNIEIDRSTFKDVKIMVATPMHSATAHHQYIISLLELQNQCQQLGIKIVYHALTGCSIIQHARNILSNAFLNSDCTHLLFIDSDIGFDTSAVIYMLSQDKDIIAGSYPKKTIKWENIRTAILNYPDIAVEDLVKVGSAVPIVPLSTSDSNSLLEPVEVAGLPTGLMLIKKNVFETLLKVIPDDSYPPEGVSGEFNFDKYKDIFQFFKVCTIKEDNTNIFYGEDFYFCKICRDAGFSLWLAPWVECSHTGTYVYHGSLAHISHYAGAAVN